MIFGLFPPNSKPILLRLWLEFWIISFPIYVDPVNAILSISLCKTISFPISWPKPGRILIVPSGIPLSTKIYPNFKADNGVYSAGLRIAVQPVANTGAILNIAIKNGKFQGIIYPQTPTGTNYVYER